jgi:hypothetical protein
MPDNPKRCFVISPIGDAGSGVRKHADMTLNAIIRQALNENGLTFDVKRADESVEIGMITDHLITAILESDLIVADLSFLNQNVFYELGIAHSEEKPVIHIALDGTKFRSGDRPVAGRDDKPGGRIAARIASYVAALS